MPLWSSVQLLPFWAACWSQYIMLVDLGTCFCVRHDDSSAHFPYYFSTRSWRGVYSIDIKTKECILLAVQRYKVIDERLNDPFRRFEDFGANLWSSSLDRVEILFPSDDFCHSIVRQWDDVDVLVMRPLNRVSWFINELNVQGSQAHLYRIFDGHNCLNTCHLSI